MRVECPKFTKCCFCLPLRYGLLVWGYLKLIAAVILVLLTISRVLMAIMWLNRSWVPLLIMTFVLLTALTDVAFQVVFVVGAHKKDSKLLQVYYRATLLGLGAFFICVLIFCGFITYSIAMHLEYFSIYSVINASEELAVLFVDIVLQVYLLLLVRSEIMKLESQQQFRFVNNGAEAECTYVPEECFVANDTIKI